MSPETCIRTLKLLRRPFLSLGDGDPPVTFFFTDDDGRVDIGAVGRSLGLDPSTVLLNGYYLSRGPNFVSSVTWASLIDFFFSRGFSTGGSDCNAIAVQGRPLAPAPERGYGFSFKRKLSLEDEGPSKKNRTTSCNLGTLDARDRRLSSPCMKRTLKFEDQSLSKKQNAASCNSGMRDFGDRQATNNCSFAIKRKLEVEDISILKKPKNARWKGRDFGDLRVTYGDNLCSKKRPDSEGACSRKKQKIIECNQENESLCSSISGRRNVILVLAPPLGNANGETKPASFPVANLEGVDLGAIGRAFRLDPMTLRLNGHFLSRGANLVSSVTWDSIQSFFSARGYRTGDSACNPIVVQGKPLLAADWKEGKHGPLKRKVVLQDERSCRNKINKCDLGDDDSLSLRRKLSSVDNSSCKKPKASAFHLDFTNEASIPPGVASRIGFTCRVFSWQARDDKIPAEISCERVW